MEEIESRLRDRAGSAPIRKSEPMARPTHSMAPLEKPEELPHLPLALPESEIESLIRQFRK